MPILDNLAPGTRPPPSVRYPGACCILQTIMHTRQARRDSERSIYPLMNTRDA